MPKILIFSMSRRQTGKIRFIERAFRDRGNETLWLRTPKIHRQKGEKTDSYMLGQVESFKPDIIFINSQDIPLPVLKEVSGGSIKTVIFFEDPWVKGIIPDIIERGKLVDVFIVTANGVLNEYRKAGMKNPVYMINGCDMYEHRRRRPLLPVWKSDVAFIGAARAGEPRVPLIQKLSEICRVKVYGRDWERFGMKAALKSVHSRGYALVCGGAKIMLGADNTSDIDGYWSDRLPFTLGCGGFLLTNYAPGMERFYTNREHLVWYKSPEECVDLVREFLAKRKERERIAEQGYRYVHEHHTFHHFVDRVFELCRMANAR
jgi:spore maturation protein CgeB